MKTLAFFNNKGGVGKTSLVYHLAWMFSELGIKVVVVDLDPQANLTSAFLDERALEALWPDGPHPHTVLGGVQPIIDGLGDIATVSAQIIPTSVANCPIHLIPGDLGLSSFEDTLTLAWTGCSDGKQADFRKISAYFRIAKAAGAAAEADLIMFDVGPNLGATNRAALIGADHVVIPLAPDLFSLQGLRNLGPALKTWRREWNERMQKVDFPRFDLPKGSMQPLGYVVMQHAIKKSDAPVKAYLHWMDKMPSAFRVLDPAIDGLAPLSAGEDAYCLAMLKHYRSLMPMAMEARKPMFLLKPRDGAIGSHLAAVRACHDDFETLARRIAGGIGLVIPT